MQLISQFAAVRAITIGQQQIDRNGLASNSASAAAVRLMNNSSQARLDQI